MAEPWEALQGAQARQKWREGQSLLLQIRQAEVETSARVLGLAIGAGRVAEKWRWSIQLWSKDEGIQLFNQVAAAVAPWPSSLQVLQEARWRGQWSAYATNLQLHLGSWRFAVLELRDQEEAGYTDVISWNTVMAACSRAGRAEDVLQLLQELRERRHQPDLVSFNTAISACPARLWQNSLALLDSLRAANLAADAFTLSGLSTRWRLAVQLQTREVLSPVTFAGLACADHDQWTLAVSLLSQMQAMRVPPVAANFNAAATVVDWPMAMCLLDEALRRRLTDPALRCGSSALSALSDATEWERALPLLSSLRERRLGGIYTFSAAISAVASGGAWEWAWELLRQAQSARLQLDAVAVNAAITACTSEWRAALALLQEAIRQRLASIVSYNTASSSI